MRSRIAVFGARWRVPALTILLLALATPAMAQEAPKKVAEKPHREVIKLDVQNNNFYDMHIYGVRDGYVRSLGVISGFSNEELKIPESLTIPGADFQLLATPIGSNLSYITGPIVVGTGREVDLTVQNQISMSYYSVR